MAPCEIEEKLIHSSEKPLKGPIIVQGLTRRDGQDGDSLPSGVKKIITDEDLTTVTFEPEKLPSGIKFFDKDGNMLFSQQGSPKQVDISGEGNGIGWTVIEDGESGLPVGATVIHRSKVPSGK